MGEVKRYLSLGAGVQSTTVLLKSCRGELPKLDGAIFADTQWEPLQVYLHLGWLIGQATEAGIPVHIVSKGNIRADALRSQVAGGRVGGAEERFASMPLFTKQADALEGDRGMIRRQCTKEYKLEMIRRQLRMLTGVPPGAAMPPDTLVEQWIGISSDETRRMRMSNDWWIRHRFPLVFDSDPPMTRHDCVLWLKRHYPERRVPRSACIGCPFHTDTEWRQMRDERPAEFADAVEFDRAIRRTHGSKGQMRGEMFLHSSCKPLDEADLNDPDPRQGNLWNQECQGMCGV